jgi:MarC family membrane protein
VFLFDAVRTRRVSPAEMREVDPDLRTLRNLNTREDTKRRWKNYVGWVLTPPAGLKPRPTSGRARLDPPTREDEHNCVTLGHEVSAFLRTVAITLAALLPIINPLGSAPIFLSMTPGASDAARQALARRVARNSLLMLIGATLVGSYVLNFFGLSLAVVKIAGGLLVIATGWHLIRDADTPDAKILPATAAWSAAEIDSKSFFPLTFPLTIGPGSVSVAITLGAGAHAPDLPSRLASRGVSSAWRSSASPSIAATATPVACWTCWVKTGRSYS